jgi:hypothetical protein
LLIITCFFFADNTLSFFPFLLSRLIRYGPGLWDGVAVPSGDDILLSHGVNVYAMNTAPTHRHFEIDASATAMSTSSAASAAGMSGDVAALNANSAFASQQHRIEAQSGAYGDGMSAMGALASVGMTDN